MDSDCEQHERVANSVLFEFFFVIIILVSLTDSVWDATFHRTVESC